VAAFSQQQQQTSDSQLELAELLQRSRLLTQLLHPSTKLTEQQLEAVRAAVQQQKQQQQQQQQPPVARQQQPLPLLADSIGSLTGPSSSQPAQTALTTLQMQIQQQELFVAATLAAAPQQRLLQQLSPLQLQPVLPIGQPQQQQLQQQLPAPLQLLPQQQQQQQLLTPVQLLQQQQPQFSGPLLSLQQQQLLQQQLLLPTASVRLQQHNGLPASGIGLTSASLGSMQQQPSLYLAALARGHAIMAHNWQDATNKQRDTAWAQFDHWSWQQLGKPGQYCHPNDIVVYLESSYLHQHGRQTAADGTSCPAPSTVGSTVAHLSTRFQQLGCRGPWDWQACSGNPCNSMEVRTFKGGYANEMQDLGFTPTAAKPISESKLQQLVQQLAAEAAEAQQQANQPWHVTNGNIKTLPG
jgi:hypothetical protein